MGDLLLPATGLESLSIASLLPPSPVTPLLFLPGAFTGCRGAAKAESATSGSDASEVPFRDNTGEDSKRLFGAQIWVKEAAEGSLPPASFVFTESRKSWRSLRLIDE
jgi:hypothetical protein